MRPRARWAWLLATAVGVCASGCTRGSTRRNVPPDPLLMSKTPTQSKFADASEAPARPDPTPPAVPAGAWVAGPAPSGSSVRLGPPDFAPPGESALAWSAEKPNLPAGPYGRAADLAWLQGVLERTADERWLLRFEPVSREPSGGKVLLGGHPRLDLFEPGDVVRVEGESLEDVSAAGSNVPTHPRYRVDRVQLVRRKG